MTPASRSVCTEPRRLRSRQRGAALLEAVIVVGFLTLVFLSLVGLAGLYRSKLLAMQDSRYQAAFNATNNCDVLGRAYADQRPPLPAGVRAMPSVPGNMPVSVGIDFVRMVQEGGGVSRATTTRRFSFGPVSGEVSGHSYMLCNEKAAGYNLFEVVTRMFQGVWDMMRHDIGPLLRDMFSGL